MKIGDYVGAIYKREKDGIEEWYLCEDRINKIIETKRGKKYYTKSKFYPLDVEDVDSNTKMQEEAITCTLVKEVFVLNDITRPKVEKWIEWANKNIDKAVSVFDKV